MIVLIVGISGVGKSTLLKAVLPKLGDKVELVNFGSYMVKEIGNRFGEFSRDKLKDLFFHPEYRKIQEKVAKIIKDKDKEGKLILVDTHLVLKGDEIYIAGTPKSVIEILKPKAVIIITAPADEVLYRRLTDTKRERPKYNLREVEHWLNLINAYAAILLYEGIPVYFVENLVLEKAKEKLEGILLQLLTTE